jgi:hypothetical protein
MKFKKGIQFGKNHSVFCYDSSEWVANKVFNRCLKIFIEVKKMKHFEVTAAILINNNEILCMQRGISKFVTLSR